MTREGKPPDLQERRVLETYRYLRIGLIGAAALLGVSVVIERLHTDCWQEAISSYYYTPARAVFVGTLVAVGLVLIVIKGREREDLYLNLAGWPRSLRADLTAASKRSASTLPSDGVNR